MPYKILFISIVLIKPPFNFYRQCGAVIAGNVWGWLFQIAIPKDTKKVFGLDFQFLELLVPVAIALGMVLLVANVLRVISSYYSQGVHTAGNVGRIEGKFRWPLLGAYSYLILKMVDFDSLSTAAVVSTTLFQWKSAEWRKTPKKKQSIFKYVFLNKTLHKNILFTADNFFLL